MSEESAPQPGAGRGCLIVWCVVALALIGLALVLARSTAAQPQSKPAPDFTLSTYDGQTISLSALRGQVVIINFWASWCDHCAEEAADLERAWLAYKDKGVSFVGVDSDDRDAQARKFIEQHRVTDPTGPDPAGQISKDYAIEGLPQTFFIDPQGQIVFIAVGPLSYDDLRAEIESVMGR